MSAALKRRIEPPPVLKAVPSPVLSPVAAPVRRGTPKRLAIFRLYAAPEPELEEQIITMLDEVSEFVPADAFVPSQDLQRYYRELCDRKGWRVQHWTLAGHVLGKVAERATQKCRGKRQNVYKISRAC